MPFAIDSCPIRGNRVIARRFIQNGALRIPIDGDEMIPIEDMRDNYYALQVSETHFMGSKDADFNDATCFLNHSCDPNLAFENGGLTLVNIRDIDAGEELTWDYSTSIDDGIFEMKCSCGAGNCRNIIKSFRFLDPQIRAHLLPFSLRFIQNFMAVNEIFKNREPFPRFY